MLSALDAKHQILMLKQLPPLSATAARLLELLSDDNCSLSGLARVIGQDPAIAARILGVANSAYFGQTTPINSVEEAIIRVLGLNMVKSLAFSIAISGAFDTAKCRAFDIEEYWFRSLATAHLAREICRQATFENKPDLDSVYLAGLLFDIGKLVMVHLFPHEYSKVIEQLRLTPTLDSRKVEEEYVGVTSHQAGAWLTDRWHLPLVVVRSVAQVPLQGSECEVAVVSLSAEMVRAREPGAQVLREWPSKLASLDRDQLQAIDAQCQLRDEDLRAIATRMVN